jgi:predicted TIM-barrel fold metal-dependent hydrolase
LIDAHHHVWRLDRLPWLAGRPVPRIFGPHEPLRRDYTIEEYAADANAAGVTGSVYVQANVAPGWETEEIAWASAEGAREGLVQGTVAFADLAAPDVADVLDRHREVATLRGVRQQLHWHANPAYRFADAPDAMLRPAWQRGLREVATRGLPFELQVFPGQYEHALALVHAFPETTFVLLHAGMLEDRSPEGLAAWRAGLARFAACEHVVCKLTGLGTFTRSCTGAEWRPQVEPALDAFGPRRCIFGSNFPVESLWTTYRELVDVFVACLSGLDPHERHEVLHGAATRVYRLAGPTT